MSEAGGGGSPRKSPIIDVGRRNDQPELRSSRRNMVVREQEANAWGLEASQSSVNHLDEWPVHTSVKEIELDRLGPGKISHCVKHAHGGQTTYVI